MSKKIIKANSTIETPQSVLDSAYEFLDNYTPLEVLVSGSIILFYDEKSNSFYFNAHLKSRDIVDSMDFEASLDGPDEDDDIYKLNRDIAENEVAYQLMVSDAKEGRSFEDIVVEYDSSYNSSKPIKIYGGQHRIKAIQSSKEEKPDIYHGFRIYFDLDRHQKVEIATINNTSIAVSNDLLDRMREQMIGGELREFFQLIGLLNKGQDFADKRNPVIPTVRVARTLILNYYRGKQAKNSDFHQPVVCKTGGIDEDYMKIRNKINWNDNDLIKMGSQFAKLHKLQREKVLNRKNDNYNEFARKAISLAVVASWSYCAGLYSRNINKLNVLYGLTDNLRKNEDPLNAKALSEARLKGTDPDTYRGLGARISSNDLGRMLEVFEILINNASDKKITLKLANAAIRSYEAKKASYDAKKALDNI